MTAWFSVSYFSPSGVQHAGSTCSVRAEEPFILVEPAAVSPHGDVNEPSKREAGAELLPTADVDECA